MAAMQFKPTKTPATVIFICAHLYIYFKSGFAEIMTKMDIGKRKANGSLASCGGRKSLTVILESEFLFFFYSGALSPSLQTGLALKPVLEGICSPANYIAAL